MFISGNTELRLVNSRKFDHEKRSIRFPVAEIGDIFRPFPTLFPTFSDSRPSFSRPFPELSRPFSDHFSTFPDFLDF